MTLLAVLMWEGSTATPGQKLDTWTMEAMPHDPKTLYNRIVTKVIRGGLAEWSKALCLGTSLVENVERSAVGNRAGSNPAAFIFCTSLCLFISL